MCNMQCVHRLQYVHESVEEVVGVVAVDGEGSVLDGAGAEAEEALETQRAREDSAGDGEPLVALGAAGGPEPGRLSPRAQKLKDDLLGEFSLTVDDVAGVLEVDRSTIYRYIQDGSLAALKLGREYRLSERDVRAFLEGLVARERQRVADLRGPQGHDGPGGPAEPERQPKGPKGHRGPKHHGRHGPRGGPQGPGGPGQEA